MNQKGWMTLKLVIAAIGMVGVQTGCSTFRPFGGSESENYNALTYGEDYDRRADSGTGGTREGDPGQRNDSLRYPQSSFGRPLDRAPASSQVTGADGSFYDSETQSEPADPTNETVRATIASRRAREARVALEAESEVNPRDGRRVRSDFYDHSPHDGSLWSNENDANYFFTKGKVRALGDVISVKLEEPIIRQVAEEIKKNLTPAEQEVEMALYLKNADGAKGDKDIEAYRNVANDELKSNEAEAVKLRMEKAVRWSQVDLSKAIGLSANEEMRAEIIDRYQNGNYKIRAVKRVIYRGSSKLMALVAVAPANDFDEKDVITSGKLYEHKIKIAR